jgi:DNA-binding response OmpR family regulator
MAKILIVDDSPTVTAMFQRKLARDGQVVFLAGDGASGLSAARAEHPDLVVLDRVLPDMEGCEVCRALRADPHLMTAKVMMLTGSADEALLARGTAAGVDVLLTKDSGLARIFDAMTQLLKEVSARSSLPQTI